MTALTLDGVSHRFGAAQVLDTVSFSAEAGAVAALLGENGAGKSTLFNLISRLYVCREGRIEVCGHDLALAPRAGLAQLGIVFQSRALDANLTVAQNLRYQAALHGIGAREAAARAAPLLERLGLQDLLHKPVRQLSGGQAQRAEIARAMVHGPKLLLCDEASVGLDIQARRSLVAEVHRLAADEGVGVVWATHLIDEIQDRDRVVILHRGRVLANGSAAEIAADDGGLDRAFLRLTGRVDA